MRELMLIPALAMMAGCAMDGASSATRLEREAKAASELDRILVGYTPGAPETCLDTRNLRGPEAFGESTLIFRDGSRTIWRTEAPGCDDAGRDALITRPFGSRLCRGDIARTADLTAGVQTGSCSFGDFVPYRRGG